LDFYSNTIVVKFAAANDPATLGYIRNIQWVATLLAFSKVLKLRALLRTKTPVNCCATVISQRGPPVVYLEFLVVHRKFHQSLIKYSLAYVQYSFN